MRRLTLLLAVLFVMPLLGSDSPKEYDDATEVAGIEGTWRLVECEFDGKKHKPGDFEQEVVTFRSGTYTYTVKGQEVDGGNYRVAPTRFPPHLDWVPSNGPIKGQTVKDIYQIDGDTLRIAHDTVKDRAQGFNDKSIYHDVKTYKRVK